MPLRHPLNDSVGRGGRNFIPDVMTIKTLLNANLPTPLLGLPLHGVCDWQTVAAIEEYQRNRVRMSVPTGRVDPFDATHQSLNLTVFPEKKKPATGKVYTKSPNEVAVQKTKPDLREVVDLLVEIWPDLNPLGARVLTAQYMAENGAGENCYNWNLGNVKCTSSTAPLHVYRNLVWECFSKTRADAEVAQGKGLAHIATEEEIKYYYNKYRWTCSSVMTLFNAPHEQTRFYAYPTLRQGAEAWLEQHKSRAGRYPHYLNALQTGDAVKAAIILGETHYYTADKKVYANAMAAQKKVLDGILGPLPPPWKSGV
jgi:hypothetical protein